VLADFYASQDPNFNRERWIDYIAGKCGLGDELRFVEPDTTLAIHQGKIRKRKKEPSKKFRDDFGHRRPRWRKNPLKCQTLMIATGTGTTPVMDEVKRVGKRKFNLLMYPTGEAIEELQQHYRKS
jgi:hypothetical protein